MVWFHSCEVWEQAKLIYNDQKWSGNAWSGVRVGGWLPRDRRELSEVTLCAVLCRVQLCDYSPPGSSVHKIFQARNPEWGAIPFSWGSSWVRGQTYVSCVSCIGRQILCHWVTWEALLKWWKHSILTEVTVAREFTGVKTCQAKKKQNLSSSTLKTHAFYDICTKLN